MGSGLRNPRLRRRRDQDGIIIVLVAIFMLFVVGAMAALAIDVTTFYTARSEAQLAADGAALAGARVLANSGMTSDSNAGSDGTASTAQGYCQTVAQSVAQSNVIGGQPIASGQVSITCNITNYYNPTVTVKVQATLPTFFARIWGSTQVSLSASATAEAYNPSGLSTGLGQPAFPVATTCVKPWLLPNLNPRGGTIFDPSSGQIQDSLLLGWQTPPRRPPSGMYLQVACPGGDCSGSLPAPTTPWAYYPGDPTTSFPPPSASSVTCSGSAGFTPYQLSVAGCVQTPMTCNQQNIAIDTSPYANRNYETATAVNCLTDSSANSGDSVNQTNSPVYPFEFLTGADNPIVESGAIGADTNTFVSDSIVTVPVFNSPTTGTVTSPVTIIGFVQLFLNPEGRGVSLFGGGGQYHVHTMVINMVGCGSGATATPTIFGNGPSAVPVRLITPP